MRDGTLELGDLPLELGGVLAGARIDYRVRGAPTADGDNVVLFPHMYSGSVRSMEALVGPGRALDPARLCVIVPGQLGNGSATSPSNAGAQGFPALTVGDDVTAQRRLVEEIAGAAPLRLVVGYSMGAGQAYAWAVRHPERVERLMAIAGTARTPPDAAALIDRLVEAVESDRPVERHGALWRRHGVSPAVFDRELWRGAGFVAEQEFVRAVFHDDFAQHDPRDLACQLRKWRAADVSRERGGSLPAALAGIRASTVVMPFAGDPFSPVTVCDAERRLIPNAVLRPLATAWGHYAFAGYDPRDLAVIDGAIGDLLSVPVPMEARP